MGAKISRLKWTRRQRQEVAANRQSDYIEFDDEPIYDLPIYENVNDLMFSDIDSVDGTYYQHIEQNTVEANPDQLYSIDTDSYVSWDSAFSDNTINSKDTTIDSQHCLQLTLPNQHVDDYVDAYGRNLSNSSNFSRYSGARKRVSRSRSNKLGSSTDAYGSCDAWERTREKASIKSSTDTYGYTSYKSCTGLKRLCEASTRSQIQKDGYTSSSEAYKYCTGLKRSREASTRSQIQKYGYTSSSEACGSCYGWTRTFEAPMERVVFLLEAFEPLIAGCVNVMEILPHLVFIEDIETFREKRSHSPRESMSLLIQRIKESDEPGKWQAFLEALKAEGYEYLANLLLEETEADHTINRRILRLFTPELINRIDPEEFIDHLLADAVISDSDREEIQCEKRNRGDIAASLMLLEKVPRRLENWFEIFLNVLERCGQADLIEKFRVPEVSVERPTKEAIDEDKYYITPYDDDISSNKGYDDYIPIQEDLDIHLLRKEKEALSKSLEKKKEKQKLHDDIQQLKLELKNFNEGSESPDPDTENRIPSQPKMPNKESTMEDTPTFASQETSHGTTVIETKLDKLVNGVECIKELLKDISQAKNGDATMENANRMPEPHSYNADRTPSQSYGYLGSVGPGHFSLDSAISMGYLRLQSDQRMMGHAPVPRGQTQIPRRGERAEYIQMIEHV